MAKKSPHDMASHWEDAPGAMLAAVMVSVVMLLLLLSSGYAIATAAAVPASRGVARGDASEVTDEDPAGAGRNLSRVLDDEAMIAQLRDPS